MNPIASLFLRAKHWQLFVLSLVLALVELFILRPHSWAAGSPALVRGAATASAPRYVKPPETIILKRD
ncbi:MAG: hypothetical protein WA211_03680 [Candidatus Acidiferrales bacterium]